jgi:hypothetical protein
MVTSDIMKFSFSSIWAKVKLYQGVEPKAYQQECRESLRTMHHIAIIRATRVPV